MDGTTGGSQPPRFLIAAVGKRPAFQRTVAAALGDLVEGSERTLTTAALPVGRSSWPEPYQRALDRSRRFLDRALPRARVALVLAETVAEAAQLIGEQAGEDPAMLALLLVDAAAAGLPVGPLDTAFADELAAMCEELPANVACEPSAYTVHVYEDAPAPRARIAQPYTSRRLPDQLWVLAADVLCAFTDVIQLRHTGGALRASARTAPPALAGALADFLDARAGDRWGLHYYTGSVVSGLIAALDERAARAGNPVLRGPSEHSLACGALARWQLDAAPALVVVTSGMVDEFRGTLANLREARARGFLLCADSREQSWFPFQGTVHSAEDSREVLRARRIPYVHLDDPARLDADLATAFARYDEDRGPVVLLATAEVLEAAGPVSAPPPPAPAPRATVAEDALAPVLELLNHGPERVLWQLGPLSGPERDLVHEIAAAAGIGLADSLTRPGSVSRYRDGAVVPEYLGTLGLYGFSERVHAFLHHEGRLRPRSEQCLFFVNSRIAEAATPFSPRALDRSLRIVQVTREAAHLAPFADHPVRAEAGAFLSAVRARLDVPPALLEARRRALAETADSASDVVHGVPVQPISLNYFGSRLGAVLEDLILHHGYGYTGVYDVGRGGLSAIRNLPRTGPGFSGWYGRALMGDALQAVPSIALTRPGNTLAFIGDGASALVPDILPSLIQQVCFNGHRLRGNLSIFTLVDGGHSVIRTYREGRSAAGAGRQTQVLHLFAEDDERTFGPLTVVRRRLDDLDPRTLKADLQRRSTVNLFEVPIAHNNEGDGLSLLSSLGWQRDTLPELTFAMARTGRSTGGTR
ncbi:hypothetical protein ACIQWA_19275 [Kitasatospora sp. NPDC098652]|uniref:hypothetical protein n=1 Tax=Kitasatospora sp. NPDC098652 TaxID=3364095 RepID=UPI00382527E5